MICLQYKTYIAVLHWNVL